MEIDRRELGIGTTVVSGAILAMLLVATHSDPDFREALRGAVGHPLGVSPGIWIVTVTVVIWLPLPAWIWHLLLVRHYAKSSSVGARGGMVGFVLRKAGHEYMHAEKTSSTRALGEAATPPVCAG